MKGAWGTEGKVVGLECSTTLARLREGREGEAGRKGHRQGGDPEEGQSARRGGRGFGGLGRGRVSRRWERVLQEPEGGGGMGVCGG